MSAVLGSEPVKELFLHTGDGETSASDDSRLLDRERMLRAFHHVTAYAQQQRFGLATYTDAISFGVARNPYSMMVSLFLFELASSEPLPGSKGVHGGLFGTTKIYKEGDCIYGGFFSTTKFVSSEGNPSPYVTPTSSPEDASTPGVVPPKMNL